MDPVTIASIVGSACCCIAGALGLAGVAYWMLKRNKDGDEAPSTSGALAAATNLASSAASAGSQVAAAGQQAISAGQQAVQSAIESGPPPEQPDTPPQHDVSEPADETPVSEHAKVAEETDMDVVKQSGDAFLLEDRDDQTRMWMWRPSDGGASVPPEQWQDFWGPLPPGDLDAFCDHWVDQQDAEAMKTDTMDEVLAEMGYPDVGTWYRVYWTAVKHFAEPSSPDSLLDEYYTADLLTKHAVAARMRQQHRKAQQNAAEDSELLAPVEGVTVESYASCAAAAAQGLPPEQFQQILANHGMDPVKWERVNVEWTDRMSKDASMTIMQFYGNAFQAAARGDFGSAGAAVAEARTGSGSGAGGEEPVPFDRLCEIQGAMTVWSTSGQDVNGMLKEVFDLTAMDWSNIQSWWMSRLATDWEKMEEYTQRSEAYEARYKEAAGIPVGDPDADIQF